METFQEALKYFITIISIINPIGAIQIFNIDENLLH